MILKIIGLLRDMILYIIGGVISGITAIIQTIIKCAIVVSEEAAYSSPLELIIVLGFFIFGAWFLFKYAIGSAETFIKFIVILGALSLITLIIIIYG